MTNNKIKSVILAAGKGTRMKSAIPKVMHDILGKTLVQRVIDNVLDMKYIDEVYTITGHMSEVVDDFIVKTYDEKVKTILQMPQLGTGDAVFKVYDYLKDFNGTVLVLCGDTPLLTTQTLEKFYNYHKESNSALTVMSAVVEDPIGYGRIVRSADVFEKSLECIIEEKDASEEVKLINEINAGVYCLEWNKVCQAFFELTTNNEQGEYYLTDIIKWAVNNNLKADAYILEDNYEMFGINSKEHLAQATQILNTKKLTELMQNGVSIISPQTTTVSPETVIDQDTVIYPGCTILGKNKFGQNCQIGPNTFIDGGVDASANVNILQSKLSNVKVEKDCTIGPFAHLRDGVELSCNVRIGNFVEVKKSIINSNTNAAHLTYIGDSELGSKVNIGAGTITANYNALTKEKSKTIIEDNVKIGSNCVLVAPVLIRENANIGAGSVITKDIPKSALALTRGQFRVVEGWVDKILRKLDN